MFSSLSQMQKEVVFNKSGKFVVRSCPGSGKTYTVAARFAYRIQNWKHKCQGIAAISFTNVAWQEIEKKLVSNFNLKQSISYPHFLGTIDSFINRYIFLPYGHLIMGCKNRPVLVGEPHGIWTSGHYERDYEKYFAITSFDINGKLIPTTSDLQQFHFSWKPNKDGSENGHVANVRKVKLKFWEKGYATQADANYFAMKILERYPKLANTISQRFIEFIIDEAQDTSDIQMRILEYLMDNGLENVMLVGDPDQAIFEWNQAKPQLFFQKYDDWKENSIILNENRRCSQRICNCTFGLSSLATPSLSINPEVKDYDFEPQIVVYDNNDIQTTIDVLLNCCREHHIEINKENVAVLYRSKSLFSQLLGTVEIAPNASPWILKSIFTKELARGKYIYDNYNYKEGLRIIEKAIYKAFNKTSFCSQADINKIIDKVGFVHYRRKIFNIINLLPKTDCCLVDWVNQANRNFKNKNINIVLEIDYSKGRVSFEQLFRSTVLDLLELPFRTGTVHTVKGETFEAVLLILKKRGIGPYYKTLLSGNVSITESEELRIVYVGMTRPKKILMLAVPDEEDKISWEKRLFSQK